MSNLTDEQLLGRANHASRNLGGLATLASLAALVLMAAIFVRGTPQFMGLMGMAVGLMAAAYWVLMVAAKRGDPAAVFGPLIAMGAQLALGAVMVALIVGRNPEAAGGNAVGLVVVFLVLVALYSSRSVLVELKERGLWEKAFAGAKPAGQLCLIGNVLLAAGFLGMNGSAVLMGVRVGLDRRKARAFQAIVLVDEKAFMESLAKASGQADPAAAEAARADMWRKFGTLREKVESAKQGAADNQPLLNVLTTYSGALDLWKQGLEAMAKGGADVARAQAMLKQGDALRAQAIAEFDRVYAAPRKPL